MSYGQNGNVQSNATAPSRVGDRPASHRIAVAVCVAVLPAALFVGLQSRSIDYPFVWTDASAIGERTMVRPAGEIGAAFSEPLHRIEARDAVASQLYYRPLQVVLLSLTAKHTDGAPRNYRALTLSIGALCVMAWGMLARRITGSVAAATVAALLVAAHPVAIESTTWISGVSGTLCSLFSILAIALALAAVSRPRQPACWALGIASCIALLLGLLSKERAAVEPMLLATTLFASRSVLGEAIRSRVAIAITGVHALVVLAYMAIWRAAIVVGLPSLPPIGGNMTTQLATSIAHWPSAIGWIFFPIHSTTSDVVPIVRSMLEFSTGLGILLSLASAIAILALFRRRPVSALGIAWIWIGFAPNAGLLPMLHATGERYLLLSSFGAALLVVDAVPALIPIADRRVRRGLLAGLTIICVVGLTVRTWTRLPDWQSTQALFGPAVERDPAYREGQFLLAVDELAAGHPTDALARLRSVITQPTTATASYLNWVSTFEVACSSALESGDYEGAVALDRLAAERSPSAQRGPPFRACVGQAHNALGDTHAALQIYLGVARDLGPQAPPRLSVMIARNWIKLARADEARNALDAARRAAAGNDELEQQVRRLSVRLAALDTASVAPDRDPPRP